MDIAGAVAAVVAELDAAGLRATDDARNANPPCVLVRPPSVTFRFGKGCWDAEFEAWALVPGSGMHQSLVALGGLVSAAQDALGGRVVTASPDDVVSPDGGTLPAYRMSWTQRIPA